MDADLKILLQPKVTVYHRSLRKFGKVTEVRRDSHCITINFGGTKEADLVEYDLDEFEKLLQDDIIVAKTRVYMDAQGNIIVRPRVKIESTEDSTPTPPTEVKLIATPDIESGVKEDPNSAPYQVGYINAKSGNFSSEPKKGYVKIEYRPIIQTVTLNLTSDQLEKIKELGLV